MTEKQQMNVRVASRTRQQLDELGELLGMTKPEVVMLAIDRLHTEERLRRQAQAADEDAYMSEYRHAKMLAGFGDMPAP